MLKMLVTLMLLCCMPHSYAQLNTGRMQCTQAVLGAPFSVVFAGPIAELTFKGDVYRLGVAFPRRRNLDRLQGRRVGGDHQYSF